MDHIAIALYLVAFGLILNAISNLGYNVWYWYYTTRGDTTAQIRRWANAAEHDPTVSGFTSHQGNDTDPEQYELALENPEPEPTWSGWSDTDNNPFVIPADWPGPDPSGDDHAINNILTTCGLPNIKRASTWRNTTH